MSINFHGSYGGITKIEKLVFLKKGWSDFDKKKYVIGLEKRMLNKNYKIIWSTRNVEKKFVTSLLSPLLTDASVSQGSVGVGE